MLHWKTEDARVEHPADNCLHFYVPQHKPEQYESILHAFPACQQTLTSAPVHFRPNFMEMNLHKMGRPAEMALQFVLLPGFLALLTSPTRALATVKLTHERGVPMNWTKTMTMNTGVVSPCALQKVTLRCLEHSEVYQFCYACRSILYKKNNQQVLKYSFLWFNATKQYSCQLSKTTQNNSELIENRHPLRTESTTDQTDNIQVNLEFVPMDESIVADEY